MAIGDAYATSAQYKEQRDKTSAADDTALTRELMAVSRMIDRTLGRPAGFNKDASAVARVFATRWNDAILDVDDYVSISAIGIDADHTGVYDTALVVADWESLPLNSAAGPEARPYNKIRLLPWRDRTLWTPSERVQVTAIWGWPAVPSAIIAATIELTAILRMESPRATNRVTEMNQVIGTSRAAQNILAELMDAYKTLPVFA